MPEPLIFQWNLAFLFSLTVKDGIISEISHSSSRKSIACNGSQCSQWLAYKALVTAIEIHLQILSANYKAYTSLPKHRKQLAIGQKPKINIYNPYGFL